MGEARWYWFGALIGVFGLFVTLSLTCTTLNDTGIKNTTVKFELDGKIYKVVVDSAATDSLHNWRTK